jgi:hypothetical protein
VVAARLTVVAITAVTAVVTVVAWCARLTLWLYPTLRYREECAV